MVVSNVSCITNGICFMDDYGRRKSEAIDRYIIVELETLTVPNVDAEEMELSSESEQSTEETGEVESELKLCCFHFRIAGFRRYSVTGISVDEPIIAQLLEQTADYQNYDTLPCMILLLISRQLMSHMTLISIFQRMRILHCIRQWMAASESTLDVMCTEDEYIVCR